MFNFTKKYQIHILIVIGIILVYFARTKKDDNNSNVNFAEYNNVKDIENTEGYDELEDKDELLGYNYDIDKDGIIAVHIKGEVHSPGIVEAEDGERLVDIIDKAGGLTPEADIDRINLAMKVEDEDFIHIPAVGEIDEDNIEDEPVGSLQVSSSSNNKRRSDIININKADKEELKKLNGVGDSTAEKIIQYREENKFKAIEDIMQVSGIGEKKFEAIKDSIAVR